MWTSIFFVVVNLINIFLLYVYLDFFFKFLSNQLYIVGKKDFYIYYIERYEKRIINVND